MSGWKKHQVKAGGMGLCHLCYAPVTKLLTRDTDELKLANWDKLNDLWVEHKCKPRKAA